MLAASMEAPSYYGGGTAQPGRPRVPTTLTKEQRSLMTRNVPWELLAVIAGASGCRRDQPGGAPAGA